jgi:hypothetical protein
VARCNDLVVTIGDVLHAYAKRGSSHRPDLRTRDGLIDILKEILEPPLMAAAAQSRGLERSPFFLEKMTLNRAALLRFYAQDRIADQAAARMKAPGLRSQLKQWFEAHVKDRYTYKDENGNDRVYAFDKEQDRIADDYFENLRETIRAETVKSLRAGHPVSVDEKQLARAVLSLPGPPAAPVQLASSVIAWDADVKEHIVATGETNAAFIFRLTNVSSNEVIIYEVHPSCECTTVRLPDLPWRLAPGQHGQLQATVDLRGKTNSYDRGIYVDSSGGVKTLTLKITVPQSRAAVTAVPGPSTEAKTARNQPPSSAYEKDLADNLSHP